MEKILKNREGITLISLVVTVIILLILAGISIGMLSGDNGILGQAGNAKTQTDIEGEKEIINLAVVGAMNKSKYGDIDKDKLDAELSKYSGIDGSQETDEGIEVTFSSGRTYLVDGAGNVELLLAKPKIVSSKIVNSSGNEVSEPEEAEQLYIIITTRLDGGTIESLICNEGNTAEKQNDGTYKVTISKNGIYTFKIVGKIDGKESISKSIPVTANSFKVIKATRQDIVNNPSKYYGLYVTNYNSPNDDGIADADGQLGKWQIFHADENNVYLIASNLVKIDYLPEGRNKISLNKSSEYTAKFDDIVNDTVSEKHYKGSEDLVSNTTLKLLNYDFLDKNPLSTNKNVKAVAYLMDTSIWNPIFKTDRADYAIGGPTIEQLFESYNVAKNQDYETRCKSNNLGYEIKIYDGFGWTNEITNFGYFLNNMPWQDSSYSYWISSPSCEASNFVMYVYSNGKVGANYYTRNGCIYGGNGGFRPLICLNSNYHLEAHTNNGNTTYTIEEGAN